MNIYSKKQRWKVFLAAIAAIIVFVSLWYTNILAGQIAKEEKYKAKAWALAIQKKAELVNYTQELFDKIAKEERLKVKIWAEANKRFVNAPLEEDASFYFDILTTNSTIPTIETNSSGKFLSNSNLDSIVRADTNLLRKELEKFRRLNEPLILNYYKDEKNYLYYGESKIFSELREVLQEQIESFNEDIRTNSAVVPVVYTDSTQKKVLAYGNLDSSKILDPVYIAEVINEMKATNPPIRVDLGGSSQGYIFYNDSPLLVKLKWYPFIQLGVIGLFLIIAYYLFSLSRKAEQNQVWVGMAKETAHQLGTPLSSLLAWIEVLKSKEVDTETISEISRDVGRLETITERFSKIGSKPNLTQYDVNLLIEKTIAYLQSRLSKKVEFEHTTSNGKVVNASINVALLEWVLENIIKNGVDAMSGEGKIHIHVTDQSQFVYVDINDSGKGIPKGKRKTVFQPGYTTKQRGWGLGLSLTKRIIENYHSGKVFVKTSELGKGTTFRIVLNKTMQNGRNIHSYSLL